MLTLSCRHYYWCHLQMRINISVAKHLWIYGIVKLGLLWHDGWAKVGCRSSCTRSKSQLTRGKLPEQNCQHEVSTLHFVSQTYTALSRVPRNNSFGKHLPRLVSSLVFGEVGEVWEFQLFFGSISNVLHVDFFQVGVQFSRSMHFC